MAIIKLGATVVGIRGTVDGLTFSANGSGPYVKGWARGPNPKSPRQAAQRNALAEFASAWRSLTAGQQADWDAYGAAAPQELFNSLGESYFVTGFSWFITINIHLRQAGEPQRDFPPILPRPVAPTAMGFVFISTPPAGLETRVTFLTGDPTLALNKAVFLRTFSSAGRLVAAHNFTFMTNEPPNVSDRITFQAEIETAFGNIPTGEKGFVQVFNQDADGQRSPVIVNNDIAEP